MKRSRVASWLCMFALLGVGAVRAEEPTAKTRKKSVTVYPLALSHPSGIPASMGERVAEVVGVFLERMGMEQIEIAEASFSPPKTDDTAKIAAAFGEFVSKQSLKTEYAVFGQMWASKERIEGIRTIVVDKAGKVVFADLGDQEAFSRSKIKPDCPMTACLFLVNRLRDVWELADPEREDAPEGKLAQRLRKRSAGPSDEEVAAMSKRLADHKKEFPASKVTVYPVHLWAGSDKSGAAQLAKTLNEQGICQAEPSETDPKLKIQGDPNEQKVLWDTARAFREFIRKNPPATQYALLADYGVRPASDGKQEAIYVHLILCDRAGNWVLVDFQNSHHPDFQSIAPKSREDCHRLAVKRLKGSLSKQGVSQDKE